MVSLSTVRQKRQKIISARSLQDVAFLLQTDLNLLRLLSLNPKYKVYKTTKKSGGFRLIENPDKTLKAILKKLKKYFSAIYHPLTPPSVFGFCQQVGDEEERSILQNATKHLNARFLWNIDLVDFFHAISTEHIRVMLHYYLPRLDREAQNTLSLLCSYRGRLPMGSPTSPVLSNFSCIEMDGEIEKWAESLGWTYTRYVDDISFSSASPILLPDRQKICDCINYHGFSINREKERLYSQDDTKIITGLVVNDKVSLPTSYLDKLQKEIEIFQNVLHAEGRYQTGMSIKKLKLFRKELEGKLSFAERILGIGDERLTQMLDTFYTEKDIDFTGRSIDWLDIPYDIF